MNDPEKDFINFCFFIDFLLFILLNSMHLLLFPHWSSILPKTPSHVLFSSHFPFPPAALRHRSSRSLILTNDRYRDNMYALCFFSRNLWSPHFARSHLAHPLIKHNALSYKHNHCPSSIITTDCPHPQRRGLIR